LPTFEALLETKAAQEVMGTIATDPRRITHKWEVEHETPEFSKNLCDTSKQDLNAIREELTQAGFAGAQSSQILQKSHAATFVKSQEPEDKCQTR
jgi:hypothetical protein